MMGSQSKYDRQGGCLMKSQQQLMLIDGYGLIYRSYFAFIQRPLTDARGENVSAIFGFFRSLFSLLQEYQPERICVAMDSRIPTFRHELFKEYKAKRDKTPQDLLSQIPIIESILEKLGVQTLRVDGFEADDVIATIAHQCTGERMSCLIVSNDKDLLQLVDDEGEITALRYEKQHYVRYAAREVSLQFSIRPDQMVDYLAIVGDSSDNIPGIPGIGAKGASKLLETYGDLETLYDRRDELTPAHKKKVEIGIETARTSRELVTLKIIDQLASDDPGSMVADLDWSRAAEDFSRIGARSLVELAGGVSGEVSQGEVEASTPQGIARSMDLGRAGAYRCVESLDELDKVIASAIEAGVFAFDLETDSLDEMHAHIAGCSIAVEAGSAWYVPLVAGGKEILSADGVKKRLKELMGRNDLTCVGQNIKYDLKVLSLWGIEISCRLFDTMVAAWLLDAGAGNFGMDSLARRYLEYTPISYEEAVGKDRTFPDIPLDQAVRYAAEDADVTLRLYLLFSQLLKEQSLESLMDDMEMPVLRILASMELEGICLLPEKLKEYSRDLEEQLNRIELQVFDLCGGAFNINSTKQLQEVLFVQRGLKPGKKTKTGYSTDTSVLEQLSRVDEVPRLILDHRMLSKLKSTYVDTLPELINPDTERIHTSYTQTGTATGRLSSRRPNLQNIPIRTEEGRRIRKAFVPKPGCIFLSADYSQIELVILAHLADDPGLKDAFASGEDVHRHTASVLFGITPEEVDPTQRRAAKTINFGVMYGMSAFRLSQELSIPPKEAQSFIDAYFARYSGIRQFMDRIEEEAKQEGAVKTIMGRIRSIPAITSRNRVEQAGARRIAVNTPIQGSAADIMKLAMIRISSRLEQEQLVSRMLLQIHDEIILEVPEHEQTLVQRLLTEEMEQAVKLKVPLRVSVESGTSWGDMH